MSDWRIVLEPTDPEVSFPGQYTLEILPAGSTRDDAENALDGWRLTFQRTHRIPRTMDFQSESGIAVIARKGRFSWRCRADCFERETETGTTVGSCYLRAKETS